MVVPSHDGGVVTVYILGTAHISVDSSRDVRLLLEAIHPDVIFLELCLQRMPWLVEANATNPDQPTTPNGTNTSDTTTPRKKTSLWQKLRHPQTVLAQIQQEWADSLEVEVGGEFRAAFDYWNEERGFKPPCLILGDRPSFLTMTRVMESLGIWGKTKALAGLLFLSLRKPPDPETWKAWMRSILQDDSTDLISKVTAELGKHFPTIVDVIVRERDAYMECRLYPLCGRLVANQTIVAIVAIVGAGHVEGISNWLTVLEDSEMNSYQSGKGQTPEEILRKLIETKQAIPEDYVKYLVEDASTYYRESTYFFG